MKDGYGVVDGVLDSIDSIKAECWSADDLAKITTFVNSTPGGFSTLNDTIKAHLGRWFETQGGIKTAGVSYQSPIGGGSGSGSGGSSFGVGKGSSSFPGAHSQFRKLQGSDHVFPSGAGYGPSTASTTSNRLPREAIASGASGQAFGIATAGLAVCPSLVADSGRAADDASFAGFGAPPGVAPRLIGGGRYSVIDL